MYICGCKRMLMPQDWINVHTHRPGEGVNIVDPCLGNVIMPGQGAVYFSLGIHPMYIDDRVEERLQKIELAAAEGKIVAVGEAGVDRNALAPVEVQLKLFERQAGIAGRYGKPIVMVLNEGRPRIINEIVPLPDAGQREPHRTQCRQDNPLSVYRPAQGQLRFCRERLRLSVSTNRTT